MGDMVDVRLIGKRRIHNHTIKLPEIAIAAQEVALMDMQTRHTETQETFDKLRVDLNCYLVGGSRCGFPGCGVLSRKRSIKGTRRFPIPALGSSTLCPG